MRLGGDEPTSSWIILDGVSGNGDSTLGFTVSPNTTFVGRIGTITVAWSGGQTQLTVRQAADIPRFAS